MIRRNKKSDFVRMHPKQFKVCVRRSKRGISRVQALEYALQCRRRSYIQILDVLRNFLSEDVLDNIVKQSHQIVSSRND